MLRQTPLSSDLLRPLALTLLVATLFGSAASAAPPKPTFDSEGNLLRPEGYREWVYIGTPLTPNSQNPPEAPFPEFHNVYIHPADFQHWKASGTFPDGTVIIKELVLVGSTRAVSGNGYFMGEFVGLEATVKDSARFADEPGHWAYFSFGHSYPLADKAAAFPTSACNTCHESSAADDFVFTQYYPVLRAAKGGARKAAVVMQPGHETFDAITSSMAGALDAAKEPTVSGPSAHSVDSAVPTDDAELLEYLRGHEYREFKARESTMHPSIGPHTRVGLPVRVFLDPLLDESLARGDGQHPAGAAAVKEMFSADGELEGWAVMVKTQDDSAGGEGWYWYEVTSTAAGTKPFASGHGVALCAGCHGLGKDYVVTEYPLQ